MSLHRLYALTLALVLMASPGTSFASRPMKIGFLTTLSGPGAAIGQEMRDGFALGITHSGGKLGDLPVEISVVDDQQNPESARQTVERFIKRDHVDLITGVVFSNVLLPVLPFILANDTLFISANSGPADYAGAKCNRNFFVVSWQNEDIPQAMGRFASTRNYTRMALIAPNYPGGRESLGGFKRQYKGAIVEEIYTRLSQLDYAAEIATLRAAKPDAVFFFLPGAMGVNFIKQFDGSGLSRQVTLLAPGFSGDEDTISALGEPLVGLYNASQWAADLPNPQNQRFVADFQKIYGRVPSLYASQAYDAARLVDSAVRAVGGRLDDREALRKALRKADFPSVRGAFRFNANQYPIQNIYLRVVQKDAQGKLGNKLVDRIMADHADPFVGECTMN